MAVVSGGVSLYHTHAISTCLFCSCTDPLFQNPSYPDVTFFDVPQKKVLSSSGGHVDFDNGVEITVPPRSVPLGTTVSVKVQPSFAPKDVFVMPQGIHSASPSYLITSGSKLDGEVTLTLEHHVKVSTDDDANDLLFLQADTTPQTSDSASVYEYKEVPEARTEFLPGETTGRLTTRRLSDKFVKVGRRIKEWFNSELTRQYICTYGLCKSNTITCMAVCYYYHISVCIPCVSIQGLSHPVLAMMTPQNQLPPRLHPLILTYTLCGHTNHLHRRLGIG